MNHFTSLCVRYWSHGLSTHTHRYRCMHTDMSTHMCTPMQTYMYTHMHMNIMYPVHMPVCMHVSPTAHAYVYVHTQTHVVHTHADAFICMCVNTHAYTDLMPFSSCLSHLNSFCSLFKLCLYWSMLNLWKCCISFRCKTKWFSFTYIHYFSDSFSHIGYYRVFSRVPHALQ